MGKSNKDNRDKYYRMAKQEGWRARSAFKLLYLDEYFSIFKNAKRVVDLCAAPGSWSQVLSRKLYLKSKDENGSSDVKIVAVDLQPMVPIEGITQIEGDITRVETAQKIISHFEGLSADLVVCDGSPDVTGLHSFDVFMQGELLFGAIYIAANVLRQGGTFVAKIFVGDDVEMWLLKSKLRMLFKDIFIIKPPSSRKSSIESYAVCMNHKTHPEFDPTLLAPYLNPKFNDFSHLTGMNRKLIAFIARGDLNGFGNYEFKCECEGEIHSPDNTKKCDMFGEPLPEDQNEFDTENVESNQTDIPKENGEIVEINDTISKKKYYDDDDYNEDGTIKTVYGIHIKYYKIIMAGLSPEDREKANKEFSMGEMNQRSNGETP